MADPLYAPPRVNSQAFLLFHWSGAGLSLCFLVFRIVVRIKYFRRIWADDILIIGAWLMLLASAALWQNQDTPPYDQYPLKVGKILPNPKLLAAESSLLQTGVAEMVLFFCMLWTVKISVLIFFRRLLGHGAKVQDVWWWCVMGFTVATWAIGMGTIPYRCFSGSLQYIFTNCTSEENIEYSWIILHVNCATDVVTDLMIITIPIFMLWNVPISTKQKLALISIFSLTVIIILFAIIRVAVIPTKVAAADTSWLCTWSYLETTVAIIVSCLASFRQLFVKIEQSSRSRQNSNTLSSRSMNLFLTTISSRLGCETGGQQIPKKSLFKPLPSIPSTDSWGFGSLFTRSISDQLRSHSSLSQHSTNRIAPLHGIYVDRDLRMTSVAYPSGAQIPRAEVYTTAYPSPASYVGWYGNE